MQDLDFLPVQYRQRRAERQSQPWRIVVVAAFAVLLAAAVFSQRGRRSQAEKELAALMPQYELAVSQEQKLARLHARLNTARNAAELWTYLRHPWPRTQLLAALLAPLPEGITLDELEITPQTPQNRTRPKRYSRMENEAKKEELDKLPPAVRDLKRLREEFDKTPIVVLISGTTAESAAVHRYLGQLSVGCTHAHPHSGGRASLFSKVELDSLESAENDRAGRLKFQATLVVRPGYGQPGGPTGPEKTVIAQTNRQSR